MGLYKTKCDKLLSPSDISCKSDVSQMNRS